METVLTTLNDTLAEIHRQVKMHESVVADARKYVSSTRTELDRAQAALDKALSAEKEKRSEYDNFRTFLNNELDQWNASHAQ